MPGGAGGGAPGPPGADGAQGVTGFAGEDGADGPAGPPGNEGMPGAAGASGAAGAIGPPGYDGEDGSDGYTIPGPAGVDGAAGAAGAAGVAGPPGPDGDDGTSSGFLGSHDIVSAHNGFPGGTSTFLRADGTWAAAGGGSFSATQTTVTLPYPASRRHSVNVVDAAMAATDKILVSLAGVAETQTNASDAVDPLAMQALANAGSFDFQISFLTPAAGPILINYARAS